VEYSCCFFVRIGIAVLLLSAVLTGCSQKAGLKTSGPDLGTGWSDASKKRNVAEIITLRKSGHPSAFDRKDGTYQSKHENIWQRIFSLYALPPVQNSRIDQELRSFLRNTDYLDRVQLRAEPYLFEIVSQIEKHGIPGEFALLPIVESAFQPYAYSHAHASGIWQFIPSTARLYGLEQNWWYDGRRDIYAATQAAIRYLQKLNRDFNGDWLLALAAYNCGEGAVQNAINRNLRRHRPTDFWSLDLPRETRSYVPRLLAVSGIFANAQRYGVRLRPIKDRPYLKYITVAKQIDLKVAADLAGISMHKLYMLNPGYNQWASAPYGPHRLLIPMENARILTEKVDKLSEATKVQWRRHRINRGESLQSIAAAYGTSAAHIQKANNLKTTSLTPGNYLIVPLCDDEPAHYNYFPNPHTPKFTPPAPRPVRNLQKRVFHLVRRGETLTGIAKRYSVSLKELATWNRLTARSQVQAGKKLVILARNNRSIHTAARGARSYTIRKGDSLSGIARRFNVSISNLRKWNRPKLGNRLFPGQTINISTGPSS
jgi:membrane-bound lytic murein transglycosylase D